MTVKYTEDHEWIKLEGDIATVGITVHAQDALGDVVFVELPEVGATLAQKDAAGVVESVKAVSDIFAPLDGKVVEVNEALNDAPEKVNQDPFGEGWIAVVETTAGPDAAGLMDSVEYAEEVAKGGH